MADSSRPLGDVHRSNVEWGAHYGCGRKVRPAELTRIGTVVTRDGNATLDQVSGLFLLSDAGISRLGDQLLVQTVDVVLPLPLPPEAWGRAAALHCLSDLFAAGGTPTTAVGTLEVGLNEEARRIAVAAYDAAAAELNRVGVALVGGHSLMSHTNKIGFTITGTASPDEVRTVSQARPGDTVFLTKPIGMGAALAHFGATGVRHAEIDAIEEVMLTSNTSAGQAATACGLRCATDVSGYGLLGALLQVATASDVTIEVSHHDVPVFESGRQAIEVGVASSLAEAVWLQSTDRVGGESAAATRLLMADPQVSGGLVLFASSAQVDPLKRKARELCVDLHRIGHVLERGDLDVILAQ